MPNIRSKRHRTLTVNAERYQVEIIETPFREGIELRCHHNGEEIRISDRQLGEHEALSKLEELLRTLS